MITANDLKPLKALPVTPVTLTWPLPKDADRDAAVQLTRIVRSVGVLAESPPDEIDRAVGIGKEADALAGQITLAVMFRPWLVKVDPNTDAVYKAFEIAWGDWQKVQAALAKAAWNPPIAVLIDTETFVVDATNRDRVAFLYNLYDLVIRATTKATRVEWYGWSEVPASSDSGWSRQSWVVDFPANKTLGVEMYYQAERYLGRETARRAKAMADANGNELTAWIAAPGSGRVFRWSGNTFNEWAWDNAASDAYWQQLGRELYGKWYRDRPQRFMEKTACVVMYPNPLDPRITNSKLVEFVKGATE